MKKGEAFKLLPFSFPLARAAGQGRAGHAAPQGGAGQGAGVGRAGQGVAVRSAGQGVPMGRAGQGRAGRADGQGRAFLPSIQSIIREILFYFRLYLNLFPFLFFCILNWIMENMEK